MTADKTITVADSTTVWRYHVFDPDTGRVQTRYRTKLMTLRCRGRGTRIRQGLKRPIAAVFQKDEAVWFQVGRQKWRLDDPGIVLDARHHWGPFYEFRVLRNGSEEFRYVYWSSITWCVATFEPLRDSTEGDFFLYLWESWLDPKFRRPNDAWRDGFVQ